MRALAPGPSLASAASAVALALPRPPLQAAASVEALETAVLVLASACEWQTRVEGALRLGRERHDLGHHFFFTGIIFASQLLELPLVLPGQLTARSYRHRRCR